VACRAGGVVEQGADTVLNREGATEFRIPPAEGGLLARSKTWEGCVQEIAVGGGLCEEVRAGRCAKKQYGNSRPSRHVQSPVAEQTIFRLA